MMSDIFNIFSIDWWMDENNNALQMTDSVLFLLLAIPVAYLLLCALFSLGKYRNPYPAAAVQHRFLVLFTVLRNGKEVIESINRFLDTQQYPRDKYDVAVAATQLPEEDLITLLQMPVNIVVPDKEYCTKVYAIQQVMERYAPDEYDMIVLFNSDNHIVPNALSLFNDAYYSGCDSIQAHRILRVEVSPAGAAERRMGLRPQTVPVADAFPFPAYRAGTAVHRGRHPAGLDAGSQVVRAVCRAYPRFPHGAARRRGQPPSPQGHLGAPGAYVHSRIQPYQTVLP